MNGGRAALDQTVDPVEAVLSSARHFQNAVGLTAQGCQTRQQRDKRRPISPVEGNVEEGAISSVGQGRHGTGLSALLGLRLFPGLSLRRPLLLNVAQLQQDFS